MSQVEERAVNLRSNANAQTTTSARKTQSKKYLEFCEQFAYDPMHLVPNQVVMYIAYLTFFVVFSSISTYISGLSHFFKSNGQPGVDYSDFKIMQILLGARRTCPNGRGQALALLPDGLMKMYYCIDILLIDDLVFWCDVVLAFRALLRASNMCGDVHGVRVKDLLFVDDNMHVMVRTSKTNQFAEYLSKIVIVKSHSVLCPIYWVKEIIRLSDPSPNDYFVG